MERGRQPTLGDVAARANVSKQTISRVINNKGDVAAATRQRVLEAIRELGYQPNALARSLVTSRSLVIGLSVPNIDQPFFPQIARGVEDAAAENGYSVFLCNASGSEGRELNAIERLRGHQVAGIISFNSKLNDETIERAVGGLFPVVMINRELAQSPGTVIWPGYEPGARLATEHLLRLGRRRIVFLGMDRESNVDSSKFAGYTVALERAGIELDPELIVRAAGRIGRGFNDLLRGGENAIRETVEAGVDFDAVFASNDLPGVGAMRCLIASGVQIPEDVAIAGFGDANVAGIVTPPLTTVTMPLYEMGTTAFYTLLDRINNAEHEPRQVSISPKLIIRESSVSSNAALQDSEMPPERSLANEPLPTD
ncbi:LacI family DNA-binding transcriptional regulator [soil metagenome]